MNLKRIPFGRGNYCVSDEGEIYNSDTGLKMKKKKAKSGYEEITLCDSGYSKSFLVHRLVASAFLPETGEEVNHKNGVKTDNRVINLEWCTHGKKSKARF